jgi:hypothetical protein
MQLVTSRPAVEGPIRSIGGGAELSALPRGADLGTGGALIRLVSVGSWGHDLGSDSAMVGIDRLTPRAWRATYSALTIAGGCHVPAPTGRMEGGVAFGQ